MAGLAMIKSLCPLILFFVLVVFSCKTPTTPLIDIPSKLSSATKEIIISSYNFTLSASLWRDFQPISPPDGKPLILLVDIIESNSKTIPSSIKVDSFWVINGDQIWSGILPTEEHPTTPLHTRRIIIRDGPKWETGIYVDLVIRLLDREKNTHWLKQENLLIERTQ